MKLLATAAHQTVDQAKSHLGASLIRALLWWVVGFVLLVWWSGGVQAKEKAIEALAFVLVPLLITFLWNLALLAAAAVSEQIRAPLVARIDNLERAAKQQTELNKTVASWGSCLSNIARLEIAKADAERAWQPVPHDLATGYRLTVGRDKLLNEWQSRVNTFRREVNLCLGIDENLLAAPRPETPVNGEPQIPEQALLAYRRAHHQHAHALRRMEAIIRSCHDEALKLQVRAQQLSGRI